jgi:hypothetical protein
MVKKESSKYFWPNFLIFSEIILLLVTDRLPQNDEYSLDDVSVSRRSDLQPPDLGLSKANSKERIWRILETADEGERLK